MAAKSRGLPELRRIRAGVVSISKGKNAQRLGNAAEDIALLTRLLADKADAENRLCQLLSTGNLHQAYAAEAFFCRPRRSIAAPARAARAASTNPEGSGTTCPTCISNLETWSISV